MGSLSTALCGAPPGLARDGRCSCLAASASNRRRSHAGGVVNSSFLGGVAIEGTDPVAYFTESKPLAGLERLRARMDGRDLALRPPRRPRPVRRRPGEIRAPVRRLLRLGSVAKPPRQDRSRGLEDRRRQALPQLIQGRAGPVVGGRPRQHQEGRCQLAEPPRRARRLIPTALADRIRPCSPGREAAGGPSSLRLVRPDLGFQ